MVSDGTASPNLQPAPLRRRAVASLNDMAGLVLLLLPVWGFMFMKWTPTNNADEYAPLQLIPILITLTYARIAGRSHGKKVMGLIILTKTGLPPSKRRLLLRAIAKFPILVAAPLAVAWDAMWQHGIVGNHGLDPMGIAVGILSPVSILVYPASLMMLLSPGGSTLHDHIAGTMVCLAPEPRGFPIEPTKS